MNVIEILFWPQTNKTNGYSYSRSYRLLRTIGANIEIDQSYTIRHTCQI